jgi:hypothetical protein
MKRSLFACLVSLNFLAACGKANKQEVPGAPALSDPNALSDQEIATLEREAAALEKQLAILKSQANDARKENSFLASVKSINGTNYSSNRFSNMLADEELPNIGDSNKTGEGTTTTTTDKDGGKTTTTTTTTTTDSGKSTDLPKNQDSGKTNGEKSKVKVEIIKAIIAAVKNRDRTKVKELIKNLLKEIDGKIVDYEKKIKDYKDKISKAKANRNKGKDDSNGKNGNSSPNQPTQNPGSTNNDKG